MFRGTWLLAVACAASPAAAATIILKDGAFVDGDIVVQTSTTVRIHTRFGTRTFARKEIDRIIESVDAADANAVNTFADLPAPIKAVLNAQADYQLKHYERALSRLEPYRDDQENKAVRMGIDWLIIEIHERLGRWDAAERLLREKQERGTPAEKTRAQAHLDLFEVNPDYELRFVGETQARNFIFDEETRNRARQPGALRDPDLMRLALEEYCEQLLVKDKLSVKAFADKLNPQETYDAVKKAAGTGDLTNSLPYLEHLKGAEAALSKAQSILGDYGLAFELDLLRAEVNHLYVVFQRLDDEVQRVSPESFTPATDATTRQLTAEGRRQWQQRCDEFLASMRPLTRLADCMLSKVERYPQELRDLRMFLQDASERYKQVVKIVKKARDRTHA